MIFELSTENKTQSDDHDIEFVKNPINFLEWFKSFLVLNEIDERDIVCITNRVTGEEVSYKLNKPELDKLYYRNEYPEYEETSDDKFVYEEHPIINPDLIFKLNQGDFIDFQAFRQGTYDGGYLFWDLRMNYYRDVSSHYNQMYQGVREKELGYKPDFSLENELKK